MEPEIQGDPSAASPTATPGDTPAASPAADGSIVVDPAFEAMFRDGYEGESADSPTADAKGDQDPSQAKPDEGAAEPDGKKAGEDDADADEANAESDGLPAKTAARIEKLLEDRRKLGDELVQVKQQFREREAKFKLAATEAVRRIRALEQKLAEYGEDPHAPERQLEAVRDRQRLNEELARQQRELQEQFAREAQEARQAALVESYRETFTSALDDAHAAFPHLSRAAIKEEFVTMAKEQPDYPVTEAHKLFREAAKRVDEKTAKAYEARFLEAHKSRLTAPAPVPTRGTVGVPSRPMTDEEIVADLDAKLGPDFFRG